jgi:hypothetical protein
VNLPVYNAGISEHRDYPKSPVGPAGKTVAVMSRRVVKVDDLVEALRKYKTDDILVHLMDPDARS